jgi:hypothetical protein
LASEFNDLQQNSLCNGTGNFFHGAGNFLERTGNLNHVYTYLGTSDTAIGKDALSALGFMAVTALEAIHRPSS